MGSIPIGLECSYCKATDTVFLYPPIPLSRLDVEADKAAMREGWVIRRPVAKAPVQICPKCAKEGKP